MSSWILLAPQHPNDPSEGADTLLVAVTLTYEDVDYLVRQHVELQQRLAIDTRLRGVELACGMMHVLTHGRGEISDEMFTQRELLDEHDLVVIRGPALIEELHALEWDDTAGDAAHLDAHGIRWTTSTDGMEYRSGVVRIERLHQSLGGERRAQT